MPTVENASAEKVPAICEPNFNTERELENAIASAIRSTCKGNGIDVVVLRGFGLDLAVFAAKDGTSRTCFFEVKAFAAHHGRCGLGDGKGAGNQIRLLFDETTDAPREQSQMQLFNPVVRWVLGSRSQPIGSARYLFFSCEQAQDAVMNRVRPGKQNNLRLSAFTQAWISWPELVDRLRTFTDPAQTATNETD
jgi:hypothetical protein